MEDPDQTQHHRSMGVSMGISIGVSVSSGSFMDPLV